MIGIGLGLFVGSVAAKPAAVFDGFYLWHGVYFAWHGAHFAWRLP